MYKWIDDIVGDMITKYNTNNIYELYNFQNIEIKRLDPMNTLLQDNDSLYIREFFGNEIVFIRNDIPIELEKFILSHELAHALLHTDIFMAAFNTNTNNDKLEKQANYFALKLINCTFDEIELEGMSLEQIGSYLNIPFEPLCQVVNL